MSATTQIFVFCLLVELQSTKKNKSRILQVKREFPGQDVKFDKFVHLVYGQQQMQISFDTSDTDSASEVELSNRNDMESDIAFQFDLEENMKLTNQLI